MTTTKSATDQILAQKEEDAYKSAHLLLKPTEFAGMQLRNRLVVAPMSRVSAGPGDVPTRRMAEYYSEFAHGSFGLILTEGIYPDCEFGQGYERQPGLLSSEQVEGWRWVTDGVHQADGVIFAQIMHAGALSQCLEQTIAPSAVQPKGQKMPEYGGTGAFSLPREMTQADIKVAVDGFAAAARHAREAGFDGVEIHGANGYLIDQFITDYTNRREDEYGGDISGRVRFACDVLREVRAQLGSEFPVGIRLSQTKVNDLSYRWIAANARIVFAAMRDAGASYLHIASEGRDWWETAQLSSGGTTITALAGAVSGLPVIANGGMHRIELAEEVLREGHADLVSLGRGALANPDWPARLLRGEVFEGFDHDMISPSATLEYSDRWRLESRG